MDPASQYNLLYEGMSEQDRNRLESDIESVIDRSINETKERMTKAFDDLSKEIQSEMLANVWGDFIGSNSTAYDFIGSLQAQIWKAALEANPSTVSKYKLDDLVTRWRKNFPEQWAEIVNADAAKEIESLKESLRFERSINGRGQY